MKTQPKADLARIWSGTRDTFDDFLVAVGRHYLLVGFLLSAFGCLVSLMKP